VKILSAVTYLPVSLCIGFTLLTYHSIWTLFTKKLNNGGVTSACPRWLFSCSLLFCCLWVSHLRAVNASAGLSWLSWSRQVISLEIKRPSKCDLSSLSQPPCALPRCKSLTSPRMWRFWWMGNLYPPAQEVCARPGEMCPRVLRKRTN